MQDYRRLHLMPMQVRGVSRQGVAQQGLGLGFEHRHGTHTSCPCR
jgi:hypothetical protein